MEMRRVVERQVLCFFFFGVKLQVYAIIVTLSNWTFVNYSVDCSFHFVHSINRRRKWFFSLIFFIGRIKVIVDKNGFKYFLVWWVCNVTYNRNMVGFFMGGMSVTLLDLRARFLFQHNWKRCYFCNISAVLLSYSYVSNICYKHNMYKQNRLDENFLTSKHNRCDWWAVQKSICVPR